MEITKRIRNLRNRGYSTAAIARHLGISMPEVVSLINEGCHKSYEPTEEEIYEQAAKLRPQDREPQGYPLQMTVEVTRASLMGCDRRGKGQDA